MSAKRRKPEWIGGRLPLPVTVQEPEPHEPDVIIWLSLPEDLIVAGDVVDPFEPAVSVADVLVRAIEAPMAGPPRRPSRIRVASEELAEEVRAVVPDIDVVVAPTPELDAVVSLMAATFPGGDGWGYREGGMVSDEVIADLFAGARLLYTMAPWKKGAEQQALRVDIPALGIEGACVATMGALGESIGINVFPSLGQFLRFLEAVESMLGEAGEFVLPDDQTELDYGTDLLSLSFATAGDLPAPMRREALENGWAVAAPEAYPWPQYRDHSGTTWPLGEDFLRALAALCQAMATFTVKYAGLFERESFKPVCESFVNEDDLEVRITMPYEAWSLFDVNDPPAENARFRPQPDGVG